VNNPSTTASLEDVPDLVRRAQGGDQEAFGALMQSHHERVFRTVLGVIRDEHDARDVCQEVWITVWKNLGTYRGDAQFTTWLHPIAVRRAVDHLRRRQKWFHRFLPFAGPDTDGQAAVPEPVAEDSDPRQDSERRERRDRFERALGALPEKHRMVLVLREVEGLSYEQIAKTLNCRAGTVMSRLFNARRLLAQKLGKMP
jgi:RNA polymerase sigma-70 factor (ECF subfamily)